GHGRHLPPAGPRTGCSRHRRRQVRHLVERGEAGRMSTSRTADFAGFFDDAAIFPPGLAALPDAVRAHLERRATPVEALTGCLLLTIDRLPDAVRIAVEVAGEQGIDLSADPLRVGLVVAPG